MTIKKSNSFLQILEEFRFIIIRIISVFITTFLIIYYNSNLYMQYFLQHLSNNKIININFYLTDSFFSYIYLSLYLTSIFLILYIYYEVYYFIYDALLPKEIYIFYLLIISSISMYLLSLFLTSSYIAPLLVNIFLCDESYIRLISLIDVVFILFYMFYITLQLPVLLIGLVKLNILSINKLKTFRKYFILLSFILAAIITPPDIISQLVLATLLILIYEIIIFILE